MSSLNAARLFYFPSDIAAHRVRLALGYKQFPHRTIPLSQSDDETFFELGIARCGYVLALDDGQIFTDSIAILEQADTLFAGPPLFEEVLSADAWKALLNWRRSIDAILARLYAPVLPAYGDIAADENTLGAYKATVEHRFGMSVEALSNDRYDGYRQLAERARLPQLAQHLAREKFYYDERLTAADLVIAADFFPLQLLDGVTLPLDLMYYFERVAQACNTSLRDGITLL